MKIVWIFTRAALTAIGPVQNYKLVTQDELVNPSANDWLMYSRTYDAQHFSPLNQSRSRTSDNSGSCSTAT